MWNLRAFATSAPHKPPITWKWYVAPTAGVASTLPSYTVKKHEPSRNKRDSREDGGRQKDARFVSHHRGSVALWGTVPLRGTYRTSSRYVPYLFLAKIYPTIEGDELYLFYAKKKKKLAYGGCSTIATSTMETPTIAAEELSSIDHFTSWFGPLIPSHLPTAKMSLDGTFAPWRTAVKELFTLKLVSCV